VRLELFSTEHVEVIYGQPHMVEAPALHALEVVRAEERLEVLLLAHEALGVVSGNGVDLAEPTAEVHSAHPSFHGFSVAAPRLVLAGLARLARNQRRCIRFARPAVVSRAAGRAQKRHVP
jgi:hypothetical protein